MTKELAELIHDAAGSEGLDEVELLTEYSGRGMYGKSTHAISGPMSDIMQAMLAADASDYLARNHLSGFRRDSMGLGVVIY